MHGTTDSKDDAVSAHAALCATREALRARLIGREALVERLLIALLTGGHVLIEGAPGLAKTRAVKLFADLIAADFVRIQATPDLLPADLTGTTVFRPESGGFEFVEGPLFSNIVLVDEINRAPPKVQSALLEAMGERQISAGGVTRALARPFMVAATQNPIEHEGTYPLPEAQLDRFLFFVDIPMPGLEEERRLAYVGLTRAKKNLHLWFVSNRRIHGLWQSTIPSRFLDELPEAHVEVAEAGNSYGGYGNPYGGGSFGSGRGGFSAGRQNPYGASRFDSVGAGGEAFSNTYATPGWARAKANRTEATSRNWGTRSGHQVERIGYGEPDSGYGAGRGSVKSRTIEGELVAKSVADTPSPFSVGDRVFHQKFGNGNIAAIEGNKLTIDFDRAGQKKVLDSFVTAA